MPKVTESDLLKFISDRTGWNTDTNFTISDNISDSLELLQLLQDIEDHYNVRIPILDLSISSILSIINEST